MDANGGVGAAFIRRRPHDGFLPRGTSFGRYTVLEPVGRGGMGQVYSAYDPELDRKIALKLLHPTMPIADGRGPARLMREAKAIAKLSHPNVIAVHDAGTVDDSVFIAMEFVEGSTLKDWLAERARPRHEILGVFAAAGRGLAAAHSAGLVHRDFKPQNVMVATNGAVRVMDFGLAQRMSDEDGSNEAPTPLASDGGGSTFGPATVKLTQTGVAMGTPAYMAPEQFASRPTDARTDQFSFCVALYEGLYGHRPFVAGTYGELMIATTNGVVEDAPPGARVPAWMRRVLLRGLEPRPDRRFPSMEALLAALARDPTTGTRRAVWVFVALGCLVSIAFGIERGGGMRSSMCQGGSQKLTGLWEPAGTASSRKEQIRRAFAATGRSYASQAYGGASRLLDEFVGKWLNTYRETCEATQLRGEQSAEVLDLRMACLGQRLGNLRALTDVFAKADDRVVQNAVSAAGLLPTLDGCANVALLRAVVRPPSNPAARRRIDELQEELARLIALRDSGQCAVVEQQGTRLIKTIEATNYSPLLAAALHVMGTLGYFCGDPTVAIERSKQAYAAAVVGHDDVIATEAATAATVISAERLGDHSGAHDWLMIARASLSRQGGSDRLRAYFASAEGTVMALDRDFDGFVAKTQDAQRTTAAVLGPDHPLSLAGLLDVGDALLMAGHVEQALVADRDALSAAERVYGPVNGLVAADASNLCEALNRSRRFSEAHAACSRAIDVWREVGAEPAMLAYGLTGLGEALLGEDRQHAAVAPLAEALDARVNAKVAPMLLGESRFALARALWCRPADRPRALELARQARIDSRADVELAKAIDAWRANPLATHMR
jgi:hypothetical protein